VQIGQGLDVDIVSHRNERMRWKEQTNWNSDPMAETRVYTNNQLADNREPGKKKKLQTEKERSSRRNKPQETSSQSFDIEVVSNKYERMSQKEETNLVVVVSELYIGTRELGFDDAPEPVHWQTICDIRRIG
jgi:hypothetical protein